MIRKLQNVDINKVVDIWLKTNLEAHDFIPGQYWTSNYEAVKKMLPQAEVYVYEDNKIIQGFVGVRDEYIEGIFVSGKMQSHGIGKALLDYIKDKKARLQLNVYQKNVRAISFYQREGFTIQSEGLNEFTGEKEYVMEWAGGMPAW
ncbi:N-acetyltransferase [Clostridiaceae bacterium OM08-6BH]|nr:N-acetyltransferase [Clostridiaceae bacterium OM08-6BH]